MYSRIDIGLIASTYTRYKLTLEGVNTFEVPKSLQFGLLTSSMQKLSITSSIMANHKTVKEDKEYNYNFWEFKVPQGGFDFLICVCLEKIEEKIKVNGCFVFPKEIVLKLSKNYTINIFESDISGLYSREPKLNKHKYFEHYENIKKV
jgi:hypothetical protein